MFSHAFCSSQTLKSHDDGDSFGGGASWSVKYVKHTWRGRTLKTSYIWYVETHKCTTAKINFQKLVQNRYKHWPFKHNGSYILFSMMRAQHRHPEGSCDSSCSAKPELGGGATKIKQLKSPSSCDNRPAAPTSNHKFNEWMKNSKTDLNEGVYSSTFT